MAVDKIIIEVTGDAKGVDKTIDQLEKVGKVDKENAAQFEKHNKQFQKAVGESSKAVNSHVESLKSLVPAVTAAFAVQTVIAFGKASLNAFIEAERGEKLLLNALGKNEAAFKRLTEAAKKYQATTVYDDDTIIAAQTFLATQGRTEEQINKVIKAATNLSAVTGDSLQSSVEKLDATYEGSIGRFGKLDSRLKSLTLTQLENGAAVDLLAEKYAGFAEAELETTAGKLRRLENAWGEVKETVGAAIVDMADRIADRTITGGLIAKLLFGKEPEAAQTEFEKVMEGYKSVIASFNATTKKYEDQVRAANPTVGDLVEKIKALQNELKDVDSATKYTAKMNEIKQVQEQLEEITGKATTAIKEQKKELDKPTKIDDSLGGTLDVTDYELKQKEIAETNKKTTDAIKDNEDDLMKHIDKLHKEQDDKDKKASDERIRLAEEEAQRREQIEKALQQAVSQLITMAVDYQLSLSQKQTDYELELLQEKLDAERITQDQYNSQRRAILKDQAQKQKEAAIIKATIDTANAVINAFSEGGPVLAAIAGAVGIAQLAIISATPIPEFEKGGRIGGKRHRDGGTPLIAEKDEFIINRKAASKIGFDNLEMLNKGIVPVKLLKQGISDSRDKKMENTLKAVFGSNDFDTYPIEKELRKNRKHDTELTHLLIKNLKQGSRKRGGY